MTSQAITTLQAWHNALNNGDKEKLSVLVKEDVKIGGPRGSVMGVNNMLEWVDRAQITLTPQRYFKKNEVVAVEELGEWHSPETGEVTGKQVVTTVFVLQDHLIASIARYDTLEEAFEASGLGKQDGVKG